MSATAATSKSLITPLRIYLLFTACLILLVTAPFTIGIGVARLDGFLSSLNDACRSWAVAQPLTSWLVTGGLGFALMSYVVAIAQNDEAAFKNVPRGVMVVVLGLVLAVALEYLFFGLPSTDSLVAAFGVAGGTPEWLNGLASIIVIGFANALHIAIVLCLMYAMATAGAV